MIRFAPGWRPEKERLLNRQELGKLMRLNRDIFIRTMLLAASFTWMTRLGSQQGDVVLAANGPKFSAWVGGIQVSDWYDDREPHENPRKGSRLEAGTIMIQGHDPGTDAKLKQIRIKARN